MNKYISTIKHKTTLHLSPGQMNLSDPRAPQSQSESSAWFIMADCIKQTEGECGFRMVLHTFIAGHSDNAQTFLSKINKLDEVDDLAQKCRNWVVSIVTHENGPLPTPDWLKELIR